ncbi:MAG TPA: CRTAC1 family protein [Patescibacteria group bacterium]|nr:CRTAC1 family protein [Patescibacteria group bacterium]
MSPVSGWLLTATLAAAAGGAPLFNEVTRPAGLGGVMLVTGSSSKDYIVETIGTGAAAFDFDLDGWQDIYLPNGSRLEGFPKGQEPRPHLFRNKGDGTFEDVTARSGLGEPFWGSGVAVGDYDNDGWPDLYATAYGGNRLFHNRGDGTFEEVAHQAGVDDPRWGASSTFADFDGDGRLDLYVATYVAFDTATVPRRGDLEHPCYYRGALVMCGPTGLKADPDILYHNNGDGTFTDATIASGIRTDLLMFGLGVVAFDYDEDGHIDIYVANDATPNQLYHNRGDGTFDEVAAVSGVAYGVDGAEEGSMGTSAGDFDGDGHLDLLVTNFSHQFYQLLRYAGGGYFEDVTFATGLAEKTYLTLGWATDFFDYDNDGWLDIFFSNGHVYPSVDDFQIGTKYLQPCQLFRNVTAGSGGGRVFQDVSGNAGPGLTTPRAHRAGGVFDFDRDGRLDLLLTVMDGAPLLLHNESPSSGHWVELRLAGKASNRSAIGARISLKAGGRSLIRYAAGGGSFLWSSDTKLHAGLGAAKTIDGLQVLWPSGARQEFRNLAVDREYQLVEGEPIQPAGKP